jgi:hypothetical protein
MFIVSLAPATTSGAFWGVATPRAGYVGGKFDQAAFPVIHAYSEYSIELNFSRSTAPVSRTARAASVFGKLEPSAEAFLQREINSLLTKISLATKET